VRSLAHEGYGAAFVAVSVHFREPREGGLASRIVVGAIGSSLVTDGVGGTVNSTRKAQASSVLGSTVGSAASAVCMCASEGVIEGVVAGNVGNAVIMKSSGHNTGARGRHNRGRQPSETCVVGGENEGDLLRANAP